MEIIGGTNVTPKEDIVETPQEKQALENARKKRVKFNFEMINIQPGTQLEFYKDKTYERVNNYLDRYPEDINEYNLNNTICLPIYELLDSIEWKYLINGIPSRFHGDLHFENIIYNDQKNKFTFLDWRQDFAGFTDVGDIYYDLAKILHGLIVSHEIITKNLFEISWQDEICFDFKRFVFSYLYNFYLFLCLF